MAARDFRWTSRGPNRAVKDATVKRFHCGNRDRLRRRLKTLKILTPYEFVGKQRAAEPKRFGLDPIHRVPGPSSQILSGS